MEEDIENEVEERTLNIIFIREFKSFTALYNKKQKNDYILNVNKIIKDKFNSKFIIPNKIQAFLINYEIKKLLDKAIYIKNKKYSNIIYLNSNISGAIVESAMRFIESEYSPLNFKFNIIESSGFDEVDLAKFHKIDKLNYIKL